MAENIKITTQYLKAKENAWAELAKQAENAFFQAAALGERLEQYFWGQIAYRLKTKFHEVEGEGKLAFEALRRHVENLNVIARVYEEAERSNAGVITDN